MILYKLTFGNKFLVFFGIKSYKTIIILRFHEGSHLLCATLYYAFGGFIIDKALKISNKMYVIFCDELSAMNNSPATNNIVLRRIVRSPLAGSTTRRLQTFRLYRPTRVQGNYTSNFCFSKSLFSSIPTSTYIYTMIPFYQSHFH